MTMLLLSRNSVIYTVVELLLLSAGDYFARLNNYDSNNITLRSF